MNFIERKAEQTTKIEDEGTRWHENWNGGEPNGMARSYPAFS